MIRTAIAILLAASLGVSCNDAVGTAPIQNAGRHAPLMPTTDADSDPMAILQRATQFESAAVGVAGQPSKYALAWRKVLRSPDAASQFRSLLETGATIPGRLYGLAGLRYVDPDAARAWRAAPPSWAAEEVDILFGCIGGRVPIVTLLPRIIDGAWIREWSSDSTMRLSSTR